MCSSPILIKNPYHNNHLLKDSYDGKGFFLPIKSRLDYLHDTVSEYIKVPCGQCSACISTRQNFYLQRIQMESLYSHMFFFTLTYADRGLVYTDIGDYHIAYPNYKDIQNLFKSIRKLLLHPIKMCVVSEYGSLSYRPHFHGILAVNKLDIDKYYKGSIAYCEMKLSQLILDNWKRNTSKSHRYPIYIKLCDYVRKGNKCTFDFHFIEPIPNHENDVSYYVTKYILKYDERIVKLLHKVKKDSTLSDKETKELISSLKPRCVMSKDFGSYKLPLVSDYIKKCLSKVTDYPSFFDINTGRSMLLSPYYGKRFIDLTYKFEKYWKWLQDVQYFDVSVNTDSYNPELLSDEIIADFNYKSYKSRLNDKKLRKIKNYIKKK